MKMSHWKKALWNSTKIQVATSGITVVTCNDLRPRHIPITQQRPPRPLPNPAKIPAAEAINTLTAEGPKDAQRARICNPSFLSSLRISFASSINLKLNNPNHYQHPLLHRNIKYNFIMAPPSAIHTSEIVDTGASIPSNGHENLGTATQEPGLTKSQAEKAEVAMPKFPGPKKFADKYEEREYQKGRLALAFRIFAKLGFDEGVAGHITLRVSLTS